MDESSTLKEEGLGPESHTFVTRDMLWLASRVALVSKTFPGVGKLQDANVCTETALHVCELVTINTAGELFGRKLTFPGIAIVLTGL
jgi:hypothetical protein